MDDTCFTRRRGGMMVKLESTVSWVEFKRRVKEGSKNKESGFINTLNDVVKIMEE